MTDQELQRWQHLLTHIPQILEYSKGKMLYIGASPARAQFVTRLKGLGYQLGLLEAHKPNCEHYAKDSRFYAVWRMDVRYIAEYLFHKFPFVIWWHGPEHLRKDELALVLKDVEAAATKLVILGCPFGEYEQDEVGGNRHEKHLSHLYPQDLIDLGYNVATLGEVDTPNESNMLAWKEAQ